MTKSTLLTLSLNSRLSLLNKDFSSTTKANELIKSFDSQETKTFENICAHCHSSTDVICYEAHEGSWIECLGCKQIDVSVIEKIESVPELGVAFDYDHQRWIELPKNLGASEIV